MTTEIHIEQEDSPPSELEKEEKQDESVPGDDSPEDRSASDDGEMSEVESESEEESDDPQAEVGKWRDRALRSQADLENYRKRMAREKSEAVQYANLSLLRGLLPILDNFEMGLQAAKSESEDSMIYQGMAMVRKQIEEFLREEGAEPIETGGNAFDPNLHEAVKQEPSDEFSEGTVISEVRRGYLLGDRLLRPANVIISSGPERDAPVEDEESGEDSG